MVYHVDNLLSFKSDINIEGGIIARAFLSVRNPKYRFLAQMKNFHRDRSIETRSERSSGWLWHSRPAVYTWLRRET